jgi:hypothetical protein
MLLLALWGCSIDCGTASFVTGGDALAMWDTDADGLTADLIERCGATWGSYGLRRSDLGLTELILAPNVSSGKFEEDLEVATLLLPAATLTFYTAHLAPGATLTLEQIGGSGLSKLHGTVEPGYTTYGLLEASLTVVDGPRPVPGGFEDTDERWDLEWDVLLGDIQSGQVLQEWHAADALDITDGTSIGDPTAYPPDWYGPPS